MFEVVLFRNIQTNSLKNILFLLKLQNLDASILSQLLYIKKSLGICAQNSQKAINTNYRKTQSRTMKHVVLSINLFPIYVNKKPDMTTAKKDLRCTHISVPKGLEVPAHMMRMSSISSAAVYDCTS